MKKLYPLLLLASAFHLQAQGVASISTTQNFTTATTGAVIPNNFTTAGGPAGSVGFRMTYYIQAGSGTVSALSVELDGAATATGSYTALTPAVGGGSGSGATLNPVTTSPQGQNNLCCDFYPFLHIKVNTLTVATGSPILVVKIIGYAGTSAAVNGNGGGGGGGGGTGNAAQVVTYTPAASVTLTCPSASAGTVVTFDPGGVALAANMALTFASCTTGEIAIVRVIQAASGGPFTVSGLPTGSPQISTYPGAGTIYTLEASAATTMNFVNVAANAGASSLGAGANGISRTVTAGTGGVTVNLLAAKDASNPTRYVLPGAGGCGSGVAGYSATSGNTFELYTVPGTVLTMVADGTITAGHIVTGGSSTVGRVADTGQTARTSVALGTCIVGIALASAIVGNTVLVAFDGTGIYGAGAASSVAWNAITNPTGNLSLTMGANTSLFTYNATTGAGVDLFKLTDTASNTGTGILLHVTTASGSAAIPWKADANGAGWTVNALGNFVGTGTVIAQLPGGSESAPSLSFGSATGIFSSAPASGIVQVVGAGTVIEVFSGTNNRIGSGNVFGWSSASDPNGALNDTGVSRISAGVMGVGTGAAGSVAGTIEGAGLIATAAAPTVAAAQIGYGSTTAASSNCGALALSTACVVINVAGTTRYIPYY